VNEYTYDAGGNLTSFTDAGGTVAYVYNGVNNVTQIIEPGASPIVLDYHDDHLRKRISYPNGVSQCFWFDFSDRIEFAWSQRSTDCTKQNPTPPPRITDYTYTYERPGTQIDTGLIQTVSDQVGNATTYSYDDLNRLEQAATIGPNAKTFAYTYDHNSNRLTETVDGGPATSYDYSNNADQLESAGATTFTYDANGNELTASGRRSATYNAKDHLDSLTPQGQSAIAMSYTGAGQFDRVTRGSTAFTNSGLGLTREDATSYTHEPNGFLLGQRTPTRTYFLHDGLGSIVATTNDTGQESLIARYEPFGRCLANCPAVPYRWLGGLGVYWDESLQLYKTGTRYYDAVLGRFTQADPIAGGSANAYDYAGQNPINAVDLDGLEVFPGYGFDPFSDDIGSRKARHDAVRSRIANQLRRRGFTVREEVVKNTPLGRRVVDIEVSRNGKVLGGLEVKTGGSRYLPKQRAKDWYLRRTGFSIILLRIGGGFSSVR
jgi:RHS repeat-associated protein